MKPFWTIKEGPRNQTGERTGEIYLYGIIENDPALFDGDPTPKGFVEELAALGAVASLDIRINSEGGNVFAGQAIHSILRRHEARKVVTVDGLAASIASVIAMAGDEVVMPVNSMMFVHNPQIISIGEAADHRKTADELDRIREGLIAAYQDRTRLPRRELIDMLDAETWMTAQEAVDKRFADRVEQRPVKAAMVDKDVLLINGLGVNLRKYEKRPNEKFVSTREAAFARAQENRDIAAAYSAFRERSANGFRS